MFDIKYFVDLELWPDSELSEPDFDLCVVDDSDVTGGGSQSSALSIQCCLWVSECLKVRKANCCSEINKKLIYR